jgi:hypothetical protein
MRALNPRVRRARKGELFIRDHDFPEHLRRKVARELPGVEWEPVERGLREWLVCCAHRGGRSLAMPSRTVDVAWHAFILDTAAYRDFCEEAFGRFLDHFPEGSGFDEESAQGAIDCVRAWDRSAWSRTSEATLWELDSRLGIEDPWGVPDAQLAAARINSRRQRSGAAGWGYLGPYYPAGGGGGDSGAGGGDSGGGGCGGGGCGGGG